MSTSLLYHASVVRVFPSVQPGHPKAFRPTLIRTPKGFRSTSARPPCRCGGRSTKLPRTGQSPGVRAQFLHS